MRLKFDGEPDTDLYFKRETLKQLTRIADSLEKIANAQNTISN